MKKTLILVMLIVITVTVFAIVQIRPAVAAIACTLNNPDQDVKRIFPESTSYRTVYIRVDQRGGKPQYEKAQKLLGDKFDNIYETIDTPLTYYNVFKGDKLIGRVHGVNQKGKFGLIQVILATDPNGKILSWYYQRLSSPDAGLLRGGEFNKQFAGLTLADFYKHDYFKTDSKYQSLDKVGPVKNPAPNSQEDFLGTIRAMRKNLIFLDEFYFKSSQEKFFEQSRKLLGK
jgi:hypothetical protein